MKKLFIAAFVMSAAYYCSGRSLHKEYLTLGYKYYSDLGYYKFHTDAQNCTEALLTCQEEDAHLAIINSETEAGIIGALFATDNMTNSDDPKVAFIGFNDFNEPGHYVTIFNQLLSETGYYVWNENQPDHVGIERYCGVYRTGKLDDAYCFKNLGFFCEARNINSTCNCKLYKR